MSLRRERRVLVPFIERGPPPKGIREFTSASRRHLKWRLSLLSCGMRVASCWFRCGLGLNEQTSGDIPRRRRKSLNHRFPRPLFLVCASLRRRASTAQVATNDPSARPKTEEKRKCGSCLSCVARYARHRPLSRAHNLLNSSRPCCHETPARTPGPFPFYRTGTPKGPLGGLGLGRAATPGPGPG